MTQVRDIIKGNMTVLRFMHSKQLSEAYFQATCHEASSIAYGYADHGLYHPYSFMKMKEWRDRINNFLRSTEEQYTEDDIEDIIDAIT